MSIWKKAVSTLATAGLLASLLGTAVAGTAAAATPLSGANGAITCATAFDTATCSQIANGFSFVTLNLSAGTNSFTTGDTLVLSSSGPAFTSASAATLSADKMSASIDFTTGSLGSVTVTAPTAPGTTTITATDWAAPVNGYRAPTVWGSFTITWVAAGAVAVSAANSSVALLSNCSVSTSKQVSGPAAVGDTGANVCVTVENGLGGVIANASVAATITPVGLLEVGTGPIGQTVTTTSATDGTASFHVRGSGIAGVASISVSVTYGGVTTVLGAKTFTFYGPVASITASVHQLVGYKGGTSFSAVSFIAKDAAGNLVPTTTATAAAAGTSVFASTTVSTQFDGVAGDTGTVMASCSAEGSDTITVSQGTIKSNAVKIYCSDTAATGGLSFDKKTVAPGGTATLTLSAKDSAGQPAFVGGTSAGFAYPSAGALVGGGSGTSNSDGTISWTFLAPFNTGVVTVAATLSPLDTLYASVNVSTPAPVAAATNASALGKTLTGPFTTATKVAAKGAYVTFKMSFGAADAGKTITIYKAAKTASGTWGSWVKLTTRVADANGDVFVYVTSGGAWLSIRGTDGTAWTPGVQARWM